MRYKEKKITYVSILNIFLRKETLNCTFSPIFLADIFFLNTLRIKFQVKRDKTQEIIIKKGLCLPGNCSLDLKNNENIYIMNYVYFYKGTLSTKYWRTQWKINILIHYDKLSDTYVGKNFSCLLKYQMIIITRVPHLTLQWFFPSFIQYLDIWFEQYGCATPNTDLSLL